MELGLADEIMYENKNADDPEPEKTEDPEKDDQEEDGEEECKGTKSSIQRDDDRADEILFSTRLMGQTILNKLVSFQNNEIPRVEDKADLFASDDSHSGEDASKEPIKIGMDGKTKDGDMPYILLMKQLEFLK